MDQVFLCLECKFYAEDEGILNDHMNEQHAIMIYVDNVDLCEPDSTVSLDDPNSKLKLCDSCGKGFSKKKYLMQHIKNVHTKVFDKIHHCKSCNQRVSTNKELHNHSRKHGNKQSR